MSTSTSERQLLELGPSPLEDGVSPDDNMVPFDYESDGNNHNSLRGSDTSHRELEDVTFFRVKLYWEEEYCWQE